MKELELLTLLTNVKSEYIMQAQDLRSQSKKPRTLTLRRAILLIAAIIAAFSLLCGTAMAVNEDFRDFVFRILHLGQEQIVQITPTEDEITTENMYIESQEIIIGSQVTAQYVHTPVACFARNGVFFVCSDPVEMRQGSHYDGYIEQNGNLIPLESHHFSNTYSVMGNDIPVEFDWVESDGIVNYTYVDPEVRFRSMNFAGSADSALFTFKLFFPAENEGTNYPVLLNLHTGQMDDVLAGTGAEKLRRICNSAISEDHTKMLLCQEYTLYYVDLAERKLYSLDELSGEHTDSCSLIGNKLACWRRDGVNVKAWNIDLNTMERTELFNLPYTLYFTSESDGINQQSEPQGDKIVFLQGFDNWNHWGDMYAGSRFAIKQSENGEVSVIDLSSGIPYRIDGLVWPEEAYDRLQLFASHDGNKLLFSGKSAQSEYAQYLAVLDFARKTYVDFSRENSRNLKECTIYWFDSDSVIIFTSPTELAKEFYLYRFSK